jgi:molybdopterin converting factor subunit 1
MSVTERPESTTTVGTIKVHVLFFGAARDAAGQSNVDLALAGPTDAAAALEQLLIIYPQLRRFGRSLLFAVNQEYAARDQAVQDGDELALFPPVSGGSTPDMDSARSAAEEEAPSSAANETASRSPQLDELKGERVPAFPTFSADFFELTTEAIDVGAVARRVILPECGATVTLDGYAREWTRGRRTLHLFYEAYPPMAISELQRLGRQARECFEIAHIGIVHRTGRLEIGETSVAIACSAAHRAAAFAACEWAIRELKQTVPIWKKEVFADGEVWVEGEV